MIVSVCYENPGNHSILLVLLLLAAMEADGGGESPGDEAWVTDAPISLCCLPPFPLVHPGLCLESQLWKEASSHLFSVASLSHQWSKQPFPLLPCPHHSLCWVVPDLCPWL